MLGTDQCDRTCSLGCLSRDWPGVILCLQCNNKKFHGQCLRFISTECPVKLYCCYAVIGVLSVAVIVLSVALSLSVRKEKLVNKSPGPCCATCPRHWIGFGSKCFYFSDDMGNWTFSQTSCMAQEAHLAQFQSLEELNFLKRYKGSSDYWIGLHRDSPQHPWMWTNNTEYNNLVPIRGDGGYAYLSDGVISSGRGYMNRKWICSKLLLSFTRASDFKARVGHVPKHA